MPLENVKTENIVVTNIIILSLVTPGIKNQNNLFNDRMLLKSMSLIKQLLCFYEMKVFQIVKWTLPQFCSFASRCIPYPCL